MAVGSKLALIINQKGLTQKEVAERAGISPQTINSIIKRDSGRADVQILLKICKALEIPVSLFAEDALEEFYQDHPNAPPIKQPILTSRQRRIVDLFDGLTESQQDNIIGRAELLLEQNELKNNTVQVYRAARSDNSHEDEIITISKDTLKKLQDAPETEDNI